ncbi:hypothetical protein [Streptomyces sp. 7N604]|uniref:hypothetical protein n=1 Tax=Streptomyces sp. 7N604 TaxID=3457415 RepID=UPI003FD562D0
MGTPASTAPTSAPDTDRAVGTVETRGIEPVADGERGGLVTAPAGMLLINSLSMYSAGFTAQTTRADEPVREPAAAG